MFGLLNNKGIKINVGLYGVDLGVHIGLNLKELQMSIRILAVYKNSIFKV